MSGKVQYWTNGVMIGLVTPEEAEEIIENAKKTGLKVWDHREQGNFEVVTA